MSDNNWYGMYEEHEPEPEGSESCPMGMMVLSTAEPATDEDHDILHICNLPPHETGAHKCICEQEFEL
jgi:hypothetical protein